HVDDVALGHTAILAAGTHQSGTSRTGGEWKFAFTHRFRGICDGLRHGFSVNLRLLLADLRYRHATGHE
ncbi:MAG: hypothetical protein AAB327_04810, partial [Actinomycetota bacterium]